MFAEFWWLLDCAVIASAIVMLLRFSRIAERSMCAGRGHKHRQTVQMCELRRMMYGPG